MIFLYLLPILFFQIGFAHWRLNEFLNADSQLCPQFLPEYFTPHNYITYLFSAYILEDLDDSKFRILSWNQHLLLNKTQNYFKQTPNLPQKNEPLVRLGVLCIRSHCLEMIENFYKRHVQIFNDQAGKIVYEITIFSKNYQKKSFKNRKLRLSFENHLNEEVLLERLDKFQGLKTSSLFFEDPQGFHDIIAQNPQVFSDPNLFQATVFFKSSGFLESYVFMEAQLLRDHEELLNFMAKDCETRMQVYNEALRFFSKISRCEEFKFVAQNAWITGLILKMDLTKKASEKGSICLERTFLVEAERQSKTIENMEKISIQLYYRSKLPLTSKFLEEKIHPISDVKWFFDHRHIHKYLLWADSEKHDAILNHFNPKLRGYLPKYNETSSGAKDAILAAAVNFKAFEKEVRLFLDSARRFHSPENVDIVLLVRQEEMDQAKASFKEYQVTLIPFLGKGVKKASHEENTSSYNNMVRFISFLEFLKDKPYRRIHFADAKDSLYQRNLFEYFPDEPVDFLLANTLYEFGRIQESMFILNQIKAFFKTTPESIWMYYGFVGVLPFYIADRVCAGSIGSDLTSFLWLSHLILEKPIALQKFSNDDQIVFTYLIEKWGETAFSARKLKNGFLFTTVQETKADGSSNCQNMTLNSEKELEFNGNVMPLIHNYDKFLEDGLPRECKKNWEVFVAEKKYKKYFM